MVTEQHIEQLTNQVRIGLQGGLEADAQNELARLFALLPELPGTLDDHRLMPAIEIAISALLLTPPNVYLARSIRHQLEQRIHGRNSLGHRLFSRSAVAKVILGLGALLICLTITAIVICIFLSTCSYLYCVDPKGEIGSLRGIDSYLDSTQLLLLGIAAAGALGGMISIMTRLDKFAAAASVDSWLLFFTGFFKPIIGMGFALLIFAILRCEFITVGGMHQGSEQYHHLSLVLAFIAGFSERFAQDIVVTVENSISREHSKKAMPA